MHGLLEKGQRDDLLPAQQAVRLLPDEVNVSGDGSAIVVARVLLPPLLKLARLAVSPKEPLDEIGLKRPDPNLVPLGNHRLRIVHGVLREVGNPQKRGIEPGVLCSGIVEAVIDFPAGVELRPHPYLALHGGVGSAIVADGQLEHLNLLDVVLDSSGAQHAIEEIPVVGDPCFHMLKGAHLEWVDDRVDIKAERIQLEFDKVFVPRVSPGSGDPRQRSHSISLPAGRQRWRKPIVLRSRADQSRSWQLDGDLLGAASLRLQRGPRNVVKDDRG